MRGRLSIQNQAISPISPILATIIRKMAQLRQDHQLNSANNTKFYFVQNPALFVNVYVKISQLSLNTKTTYRYYDATE